MAVITLHFSFFGSVNQFLNDCVFLGLILIELITQTSLILIKCSTVCMWFVASFKMCLLTKTVPKNNLQDMMLNIHLFTNNNKSTIMVLQMAILHFHTKLSHHSSYSTIKSYLM